MNGRAGAMPEANLPGFRRRFLITPAQFAVTAALEDDIHRMVVTLHHDGESVTRVEAEMARHPWDLCPGAVAKVEADFAGRPLAPSARDIDKKANCTHLFDLAELALRHAGDAAPTPYEMLVSDPADGRVTAVLRRNGQERLRWHLQDDQMLEPHPAKGLPLIGLRPWIASLSDEARHEARMLQWASLAAHGRQMPWEPDTPFRALPGSCFASQLGRHENCQRIGERIDFSKPGARLPLAD
ncbi:hypothetical protein [Novosphingobium sp.]|uniref:hypothetical protein n=1 Tax=Novosphingobium sp. TaxID=1874826 RepID=UPI00286DC057|nr:hypothetical protein [Novosphingobium sp.]